MEAFPLKVREQGNSLVVTVPKKFGIKSGTEVVAVKGKGNSFSYVPKLANPFTDPTIHFGHDQEAFPDDSTGRESL